MLTVREFFSEIGSAFGQMSFFALSCLTIGMILILVQQNQRATSFLYFCGGVFVCLGLVIRIVEGGTFLQNLFIMVVLSIISVVFYIVGAVLSRRAWLIKGETLSVNQVLFEQGYSYLLELEGYTTTALTPEGHMSINDTFFTVCALDQQRIEKGAYVRVVKVDKERIFVKPI